MTPERWQRLQAVCEAALQRDSGERAAFLAEACVGDDTLRHEVEALVAERTRADHLLERPALEDAAAALPAVDVRAPLTSGVRLGSYEITEPIGAGGMGEVYKARDTRLGRTVAIKILPPALAADADRRVRFEREARTISALNHPHICTLYDVGEADGQPFLVMEHLVGETLAARLARGPLPVPQALDVAAQIAEALDAAHKHGIIHRDMKPANVMLTKAGAKLLDFGLAKLAGLGEQPAVPDPSTAPAPAVPVTSAGTILGTLQYMAPEQVEGKPADARTDLWALGAILYEMIGGTRAFEGPGAASLADHILHAQPAHLSTLQPLTPPIVDRLVRQCLAKEPEDRPDTAHDVATQLRWLRETSDIGRQTAVPARRGPRGRLLLGVAGVGAAALAAATVTWWLRVPAPREVARVSLDVRPAEELNAGGTAMQAVPTPRFSHTALTWTPDGQVLVFVGRRGEVRQLYARRLDEAEARPIPNTEGAQVPAVSPDGQWVAFWARGAIRKVPLGSGPATDLAIGPSLTLGFPVRGLSWGSDGRLFFGNPQDGRIWAIPAEGTPVPVTKGLKTEAIEGHVMPWPLPGERALLYTVRRRAWSWGDEEVVAQTLATGAHTVLLRDATDARYLPTGHLVFLRRGVLFAVPFDAERLAVRGAPVALLDNVAQALTAGNTNDSTGAGQFAVAATGTLAWVPGPIVPYPDAALVTVDHGGRVTPLPAPIRSYAAPVRLSPDGRRLAVMEQTLAEVGLWVYDLDRGTLTPVARDGEAAWPLWSPDGRLLFNWNVGGRIMFSLQSADATAPPRGLVPSGWWPSSFTPDGRDLIVVKTSDGGSRDIGRVDLDSGVPTVEPLIATSASEIGPELSPDGRWLAYASNASGRREVYVRPYPGPGPMEQISADGGYSPAWHPSGRELFFVSVPEPAGKYWMMAAAFAPGPPPVSEPGPGGASAAQRPRIGRPRQLFAWERRDSLALNCAERRCFDVAPDGQRFYSVQLRIPPPPPPVTHIEVILNWVEELKAKVPASRD